jgi:hypothetical protein
MLLRSPGAAVISVTEVVLSRPFHRIQLPLQSVAFVHQARSLILDFLQPLIKHSPLRLLWRPKLLEFSIQFLNSSRLRLVELDLRPIELQFARWMTWRIRLTTGPEIATTIARCIAWTIALETTLTVAWAITRATALAVTWAIALEIAPALTRGIAGWVTRGAGWEFFLVRTPIEVALLTRGPGRGIARRRRTARRRRIPRGRRIAARRIRGLFVWTPTK